MEFFSAEEFDMVFCEIVEAPEPCFDGLMEISRKTLFGSVRRWCYEDSALAGRQYEEDIMQEIQIKLIKNCVTGFFMREGRPNRDAEGFKSWMFTVAKNVKSDFAKKVRRIQFTEVKEVEDGDRTETDGGNACSAGPCERLNTAFQKVMALDIGVHKILTWVAQMLIIAACNVTKIRSNGILVKTFGTLTLDAMLDLIINQAEVIPWLSLEPGQIAALRQKLDARQSDGRRLGEKTYSEFYMKKGPKGSVSDWVNRINTYLIKEDGNT